MLKIAVLSAALLDTDEAVNRVGPKLRWNAKPSAQNKKGGPQRKKGCVYFLGIATRLFTYNIIAESLSGKVSQIILSWLN